MHEHQPVVWSHQQTISQRSQGYGDDGYLYKTRYPQCDTIMNIPVEHPSFAEMIAQTPIGPLTF